MVTGDFPARIGLRTWRRKSGDRWMMNLRSLTWRTCSRRMIALLPSTLMGLRSAPADRRHAAGKSTARLVQRSSYRDRGKKTWAAGRLHRGVQRPTSRVSSTRSTSMTWSRPQAAISRASSQCRSTGRSSVAMAVVRPERIVSVVWRARGVRQCRWPARRCSAWMELAPWPAQGRARRLRRHRHQAAAKVLAATWQRPRRQRAEIRSPVKLACMARSSVAPRSSASSSCSNKDDSGAVQRARYITLENIAPSAMIPSSACPSLNPIEMAFAKFKALESHRRYPRRKSHRYGRRG